MYRVPESDHTYHQKIIGGKPWRYIVTVGHLSYIFITLDKSTPYIYIPLQPIKDEADSQRKAESQEIQQKQQQIFQEQQLMKQQQGQQIIQQQQIR